LDSEVGADGLGFFFDFGSSGREGFPLHAATPLAKLFSWEQSAMNFANKTGLSTPLSRGKLPVRWSRAGAICLGLLLSTTIARGQEDAQPSPEPRASTESLAPSETPAPSETTVAAPADLKAPPDEPAEKAQAQAGPTDPAELAAFIDGIMAIHLKDKHIAGATIVVVVDNKPLFSKGYGYADVAAKKPVNPDETMFRIGSVSKLFTWTAVMQMVEQGKLDLNADVNQYLGDDFKIPPTFPQPITLKNLLTHTPGFEDQVFGLFARDPDKMLPLGQLLARELPARVRPPGELASYSNHGTALAGHIVAQVAGVPWEDYIEKNILEPLGMRHTSVRQPASDKLPPEMSKGYKFEQGEFTEQPFEYVPAAPAGSISASAGDMARFMIAHLQNGRYESARILQDETASNMRELLFTHDPRVDGMAHGFIRMTYNGRQIVQHGGDTFWFHSYLVLLPASNSGFFVSYNSEDAGGARDELFKAFFDRYYPADETPAKKPLAGFHERAGRYAGSYGMIRHSYTSAAKLAALFGVADVSADGDTLLISAFADVPKRFVEVEPLVFHEIDGPEKLVFREDPSGRVAQLFVGSFPPVALERLPWYATPTFALVLLGACGVLLLSALVGWPFAAFLTRGGRCVDTAPTVGSRAASWIGWIACLAIVSWVVGFVIAMIKPDELVYGMPPALEALLRVSPVLAMLAACVLVCALIAWKNQYWRLSARLHYSCVLAACLAMVWFLNYWNLLRFTV
jgi:CubicO group peptidase (beta-lactamase class C family)